MHMTFMKLNLPGSRTTKVIFERKNKNLTRTEYQLQLDLETSNSRNS